MSPLVIKKNSKKQLCLWNFNHTNVQMVKIDANNDIIQKLIFNFAYHSKYIQGYCTGL